MNMSTKKYLNSREDVMSVPEKERWKYYIAREYFTTIEIRENGERLVSVQFLIENGIAIEPIWKDDELD